MPRVLALPGMRARRTRSRETELSKAIRDALATSRIWVIRINSGALKMGDRYITLAEPGTPDLWTPYGWLEVKDKARVTAVQRAWHERAARHGVRVAVVHSVSEALATVREWEKEDKERRVQ